MFLNYYNKNLSKFLILKAQAKTMILFTLMSHFFMMIYKFIQNYFINSTPLYFIVKWLNFLLITCTSYFTKSFKKLPIFSYFGLLKSFPKTSYRK